MLETDRINYINSSGHDDLNTGLRSLAGYIALSEAIETFYRVNGCISPRDLHYVVITDSNEAHLNVLLGIA